MLFFPGFCAGFLFCIQITSDKSGLLLGFFFREIIAVTLNATNNEESTPIKLALRCDSGFQTNGNITISVVGTTLAKWALAPDNAGAAGTFGYDLIAAVVGVTNVLFWAKAKATSDEAPQNDTSVDVQVSATFEAV